MLRKNNIVLVALKERLEILSPQAPLQLTILAKLLHMKILKNSKCLCLQLLELSAAI